MTTVADVVAAYKAYRHTLDKVKVALAQYLGDVLPPNIRLEWEQVADDVLSPVVFCNMVQIVKKTGALVKPNTDPHNPHTEWVPGAVWDGYFHSEGLARYRGDLPGLSKKALGKIMTAWEALPKKLLIEVFGTCSVCVTDGKITCTP